MLHELQQIHFEHQEIPPDVADSLRSLFNGYEKSLVSAAVSAESRAEHWDDANRKPKMHVGCSILILNKDLDLSQPAIYTGANNKKSPEMLAYPERKCGEMNAFENTLGIDYPGKIKAKQYEEMEKEDLGLVVAIVTASESRNTGELDTATDDVVDPCKQCMTNYEYLVQQGVLSPKTIIYNIRIKDGKVVAGQPRPLGELLEKFKDGKEELWRNAIRDLLNARKKAFEEYRHELHNVSAKYGNPKDYKILPNVSIKAQLDIERERTEKIMAARGDCVDTIISAMKSAVEEGVPKSMVVASLGLNPSVLETETPGFSNSEILNIENAYVDFFTKRSEPLTSIQ